jgi:6-phosphogluconolactonase
MKRFLALIGLLCALMTFGASAKDFFVYFGTYTGTKSKGIYVSKFNSTTGKLEAPELAVETKSPSFLAVHPNGKVLYAVGESTALGDTKQGGVTAFAIETGGKLKTLNTQPSGGTGPCHLALGERGRILIVANYGSGSVGALSVLGDGLLGAPLCSIQHAGSSVNPQRQAGPHAHCANLSPDGRFALVCDLGLDKIMVYRVGGGGGALVENDPPFVAVAPGAGPRHLAFSQDGKFVYAVNEMGSSVTVFGYDAKHGTLNETQTTSTLPEKFDGKSTCAEIAVHPSGRFVYASNRGHDSIAVFKADGKSGQLSFVEHALTQGKTPRHFAIDPTGSWLLAENQASDIVVVFRVDKSTGALKPTGQKLEVPSPVCAVFLPVPR